MAFPGHAGRSLRSPATQAVRYVPRPRRPLIASPAACAATGGRPVRSLDVDGATEQLEIRWLGHATTLIQLGGWRFLTDPR